MCRFSSLNFSWRVTDLEKFIQGFASNSCHSLGCSIYPPCDSLTIQSIVRQLLKFHQPQRHGTALPNQPGNSPWNPRGQFYVGRLAPQLKPWHFGLVWPIKRLYDNQTFAARGQCRVLVVLCFCTGDLRLGWWENLGQIRSWGLQDRPGLYHGTAQLTSTAGEADTGGQGELSLWEEGGRDARGLKTQHMLT